MDYHEVKRSGGSLHLPSINNSRGETVLKGRDIYLGVGLIKAIDEKTITKIVIERDLNGEYTNAREFFERSSVGAETLQTLIFVGALRFTGKPKSELTIILEDDGDGKDVKDAYTASRRAHRRI